MKSIILKCHHNGKSIIEQPLLFDKETVNFEVIYPIGYEDFTKSVGLKVNDDEFLKEASFTLELTAGTTALQAKATKENKVIKWQIQTIKISRSINADEVLT